MSPTTPASEVHDDPDGPNAPLHAVLERSGDVMNRRARRPDKFAPVVESALQERKPFARHAVGPDAIAMVCGNRPQSARVLQYLTVRVLRLPRAA
jgi:hypothetical protein